MPSFTNTLNDLFVEIQLPLIAEINILCIALEAQTLYDLRDTIRFQPFSRRGYTRVL